MIQCPAPDQTLGVAVRLATYLDCQSRALGENGFQVLAGDPGMTALLGSAVTIFVALIGYRLILGFVPTLADGVGWAIRLGIVLTLVTSWPAVQTLVYRPVLDAPLEVAAILLPAAGIPSDQIDDRVQATYDRVRIGLAGRTTVMDAPIGSPRTGLVAPTAPGAAPLPHAASLLVLSTSGLIAALRLAGGLLLALCPLAALSLLFEATSAIFMGWLRGLLATSLGALAATVVTAIELVLIRSELAKLDAAQQGFGDIEAFDPQGMVTLILVFVVISLVAVAAVTRLAGRIRLPRRGWANSAQGEQQRAARSLSATSPQLAAERLSPQRAEAAQRNRATIVAEAVALAAHRDAVRLETPASPGAYAATEPRYGGGMETAASRLGPAGRRASIRQTRSARRRDAVS